MSSLRILVLALFILVVSGEDAAAPASAPEADGDEAGSPMQMQSLQITSTTESPSSAPISSSPSESPLDSPAYSPAEGQASGGSEAPGLDDSDAAAPSPLEDYDDDDDETY